MVGCFWDSPGAIRDYHRRHGAARDGDDRQGNGGPVICIAGPFSFFKVNCVTENVLPGGYAQRHVVTSHMPNSSEQLFRPRARFVDALKRFIRAGRRTG
jgi:hypothetical protein